MRTKKLSESEPYDEASKSWLSIAVPTRRINEIVLGKLSITADTALRLAKFFGSSAEFWLGLQAQYDLDVTAEKLGGRLEQEVKAYAKAG